MHRHGCARLLCEKEILRETNKEQTKINTKLETRWAKEEIAIKLSQGWSGVKRGKSMRWDEFNPFDVLMGF